jgi:hypothetical protein
VLTDGAGRAVTYTDLGDSEAVGCFGGAPKAVAAMLGRTWRGSSEPRRDWRVKLGWPRATEDAALDRAVGAMLGMLIADSARSEPGLPGQPGRRGEAALACARALAVGTTPFPGSPSSDGLPSDGALGAVPLGIIGVGSDGVAAAISAGIVGADHATVRRLAGDPRDPALAGALLGATAGRQAFAARDGLALMACRPDEALGVARPRPDTVWPDDVVDLTEALLLRRDPC